MSANIKLGKKSFDRGIHPSDNKFWSENAEIEVLKTPAEVLIPTHQHIGAPCNPVVKGRQDIKAGELLAQSDSFISAPIHSSVNGKTKMLSAVTLPNGKRVPAIPVVVDENDNYGEKVWQEYQSKNWNLTDIDKYSAEEIKNKVQKSGIVGLGGATFPTYVKLIKNDKKPVETLLLNGCECEPYLTADYRLMIEASQALISGALIVAKAVEAKNIVIAIEDNKPLAIKTLSEAATNTEIQIVAVKTKYPMGGERQLILAALGKKVPTTLLPLEVGVVIINVGTAVAVAGAVVKDIPLTHRVVSVTGSGVHIPKNLFVPIGASYKEVLKSCGGLKDDAARVISGGPMMGFSIGNFNTPVVKGTSGILVLNEKDVQTIEVTNCIRCGRCLDVCPLNLIPTKIAHASKFEDWDLAKKYYLQACCECGCCTYTCPAGIPLVQYIRSGKSKIPKE